MIEIIYNDSKKGKGTVQIKPPKNIRQIGSPKGRHKIYVEDYVYTFLHSTAFEGEISRRAAILVGKSEVAQDIRYTFISGAISCEKYIFQEDGIAFDEKSWEYIYKEIKEYFEQQEIVGWYLGVPGFAPELTPAIEAAHRKYFAGREKVLLISEPSEEEDNFYSYEQGVLQRKEGYYIYYEKNMPMQEYMVSTREKARQQAGGIAVQRDNADMETKLLNQLIEDTAEETDKKTDRKRKTESEAEQLENMAFFSSEKEKSSVEQALRNYRNSWQEKAANNNPKKMNLLLYTAASAAMVVLCIIGVTTINNYEKMKQVEQTLSVLSNSTEEKETIQELEKTEPSNVIVETVPGEVEPLEDALSTEENVAEEKEEQMLDNKIIEEGEQQTEEEVKEEDTEKQVSEPALTEETQEEKEASEAATAAAQARTYLEQGYYIVQSGDKLELICRKIYQTTAMMDKLCEVNEIEDIDKIYAGQKLVLP